jgi:hypothetical protein
MIKLVREDGTEVKKGDTLVSSRHQHYTFDYISRFPGNGSNGKIVVHSGAGLYEQTLEYYPSVFNCKIIPVEAKFQEDELLTEIEKNDRRWRFLREDYAETLLHDYFKVFSAKNYIQARTLLDQMADEVIKHRGFK